MYEMRDTDGAEELGFELLVHKNPEAVARGINPFDHGSPCTPTCGRPRG
jgi:sulfate adenylyltransferase subunit 2